MFSLMVSGEPGVTYYVKPSQSTKCPGQPCETLNYYLKNVDTTINKEKNLTMIFLNGNHLLDSKIFAATPVSIKTPVIRMVGESKNVLINGSRSICYNVANTNCNVNFIKNSKIYFKELVLIDFGLELTSDQPTSIVHMSALKIFDSDLDIEIKVFMETTEFSDVSISMNAYSVLKQCKLNNTLVDASLILLEIDSCNLFNSPLEIDRDSTITVSGTTVFAGTKQRSAITSFLGGTLTLSGNVIFANNSAIRGGALALYMSTLNIAANTTVTFMNNSANHKGGAIYVDPGISPNMVLDMEHRIYSPRGNILGSLPSFYELLNCNISNNKYNFHFVNNSAVNGGNDVYGALLTEYDSDSAYSCNLAVNISSPSNSSVSSDALRVCLCDKQGQPQCKNNSYLRMTSVIHPGETFKISAVLVGGDLGLTTGTIYADISPADYSITPSLALVSEYSNIVTKTSIAPQCREIEYRIYTRNNSFVMVYFAALQIDYPVIPFQMACPDSDDTCFRTSIVFIKFTILPCPPGFSLTGYNNLYQSQIECNCYDILTRELNISCRIINGDGLFSWTGNLWVDVIKNNVTAYAKHCPHNYCKTFNGTEKIDLRNNSTYQCEFNRRGRLCGECKEGCNVGTFLS